MDILAPSRNDILPITLMLLKLNFNKKACFFRFKSKFIYFFHMELLKLEKSRGFFYCFTIELCVGFRCFIPYDFYPNLCDVIYPVSINGHFGINSWKFWIGTVIAPTDDPIQNWTGSVAIINQWSFNMQTEKKIC